jgi:phage tail sheath protein FI
MATYVTPGVYYERADAGDAIIAPLRTDIAGFAGIARRGPLDFAVPLESWRQFVAHFGDFTGAGYLAYAVRGFFENGGRRCWIVRVASRAATAATSQAAGGPLAPWRVDASSAGVWGNDLELEWREAHRAQTRAHPALSAPDFVTVDSVAGLERGTHVRALVAPGAPEYRVVAAVDAGRRRVYWVNQTPALRRPDLERPLAGYDPTRPLLIESIEYSLLVHELGRLIGVFTRLSLSPTHPRYGPLVLAPLRLPSEGGSARLDSRLRKAGWPVRRAGGATPVERDRPADEAPNPVVIVEQREAPAIAQLLPLPPALLGQRAPLAGGLDGLGPLTVRDFLGDPASALDDSETRRRKRRGLRALESVTEIAIVAIPDIHIQPVAPPQKKPPPACIVDPCLLAKPPLAPATPRVASVGDLPPRFGDDQIFEVEQALVEHCALLHDRFALLDPPFNTVSDPRVGIGPLRAWRRRFDSDFGALYAPWLLAPDPLILDPSGLRAVPPSGHVAGFMAKADTKWGVHRAPANGELDWVQGTTFAIDEASHGVLNPEHVNAIRTFAGRGLRIFGARTLASDPDWRFVNVRRLLLMIEKAIRIGSQWATFEPNNRLTRTKLHLALTSLLLEMWRRGALAGRTAQEAFFVNCGEVENPASVRDRGMLIAEIGVAPARPFEFIVVRVGVSDNALEIAESGAVEAVS